MDTSRISECYLKRLLLLAIASLPALRHAYNEFKATAYSTDNLVNASYEALPKLLSHLATATNDILSLSNEEILNVVNRIDGGITPAENAIISPAIPSETGKHTNALHIEAGQHPSTPFHPESQPNIIYSLYQGIPTPYETYAYPNQLPSQFAPSTIFHPEAHSPPLFYGEPAQNIHTTSSMFNQNYAVPMPYPPYMEPCHIPCHIPPLTVFHQWLPPMPSFYQQPPQNIPPTISFNQDVTQNMRYQPYDKSPTTRKQGMSGGGSDPDPDGGGGGGGGLQLEPNKEGKIKYGREHTQEL
ncbi:hypothetical protein BD410DRAFT_847014 [Rickenella mellea]|uniref:Uncharacterized protein n=1 Tax=Rickenella mellea TaxID=50990 RepID=A0A4Y7PDR3_9AGAM|nr:hypothetical protein BD410DRAFT_847014 [Rickenella mellea]